MRIICTLKHFILLLIFTCLALNVVNAADESYERTLSGKIKKGDELTVTDDKFLNLPLEQWNGIRNISVDNIISFELRHDTAFNYFSKPFSCTLNILVKYFTSRDQQDPTQIDNIDLVVKYDTVSGKFYPVDAQYTFKNAFKVTVIVNSIKSKEWGDQMPDIFRIRNQILVKRKYPFDAHAFAPLSIIEQASGSSTSQTLMGRVAITGTSGNYQFSWPPISGAEEYDLEWTYVDGLSYRGKKIAGSASSGYYNLNTSDLSEWMVHDNTRVTVTGTSYTIQLPYTEGYIIARVRGVSYSEDNLRITGDWQYQDDQNHASCIGVDVAHEPGLNWQYTGTFAEEGKHKQVVTYFDGSLRNRQAVTLSNSTGKAVVAETIYDQMGRGAISVLPAPLENSKLGFYNGVTLSFNSNKAYTHQDITFPGNNASCTISANKMSAANGAAQYYSPQNPFLDNSKYKDYTYFTNYVPDAGGYPFAVTEYTPDNTGRIRRQGGVGPNFQIGSGHETQYFYSKPLPREMERLFGMEVGSASHYLKNFVIDPNGQISVSYIDASGKTIATALEGSTPKNLDALPSSASAEAKTHSNQVLIRSMDMQKDPAALQMSSSSVFFAAVTGTFYVHYNIDPASIKTTPAASPAFCSNCYYEVKLTVTNDCGATVAETTSQPFTGNDITCHDGAGAFTGDLPVSVDKIGEYTVNYSLQLSEQVINSQVDYYINHNSDLKTIQNFFQDEMLQADLKGCYNECSSCMVKLGTRADFTSKMNKLLLDLKNEKYSEFTNFNLNDPIIQGWIYNTYTDLLAHCQAIAADCKPISPCEQKLEMMKYDVRPGGQYAIYDSITFTVPASEQAVSVLINYKSDDRIPNYGFVDENGHTRHIKDIDITEDVFIKAYIQHPEWADAFVLKHIEYCSYQWCKDQSNPTPAQNNEVSYTFDEILKDQITTGQDAVSRGYYDPNNIDALLNLDPFFNGGYGTGDYKTLMHNDLLKITDNLKMIMNDASGNAEPSKNIFQLIDWMLYCKPTSSTATAADGLASWNNCVPTTICRSLTAEWELYRNYYLQLKSKYMEMAKHVHQPDCVNCFVGDDGFSNYFPIINNYVPGDPVTIGSCPSPGQFHLENVTLYSNTTTESGLRTTQSSYETYYVSNSGSVTRPVTFNIYSTRQYLAAGSCHDVMLDNSFYKGQVTMEPGKDRVLIGTTVIYNVFNTNSGCYTRLDDYYHYSATFSSCPPYSPPPPVAFPASICKDDPKYSLYVNKIRIFNDYTGVESYLKYLSENQNTVNNSQTLESAKTYARNNLSATKDEWKNILIEVRDEEFDKSIIGDDKINQIVDNLYQIASYNIDNANSIDKVYPARVLPGTLTNNGFHDFQSVFLGVLGKPIVDKGFGSDLIKYPYPEGKDPVPANQNSGVLISQVCLNLNTLKARFGTGSDLDFHNWLKVELQDDYNLSLSQLQDINSRCVNNCRLLDEPVILPVAFTAPEGQAWKTCDTINKYINQFVSLYPSVIPDTKLYRVLLTNYLNLNLGYALSYDEYADFINSCSNNSSVVLYNKPASPLIQTNDDACTIGILAGIFDRAGQEYVQYIDKVKKEFRNQLVSKCLSNTTSLNLEGDQYEYHYTLYYYDQSGNLVKTIPPEGVKLLSNEEMDLLELHLNDDITQCDGSGVPNTEDHLATFNAFSSALQYNSIHGMEMWWYDHNNGNRQLRFVTPDQKYFYQAAIANKKLWVEMYALVPGTEETSIINTNKAVADISSFPVQNWSHLFIQTPLSMLKTPPPVNSGLTLNGSYSATTALTNITNSFTVELWVNPTALHEIDPEGTTGYPGVSGQKYVFMPPWGGPASVNQAGMGFSVGTNGVSIYEHADNYMPATLVWNGAISGWTHVAVVYNNRKPQLYINGSLVKTGLTSTKSSVYPGTLSLGGSYGVMSGQIDEARIWNYARSQSEIKSTMNTALQGNENGLTAYWPISKDDHPVLVDKTSGGHNISLSPDYTIANWNSGAPLANPSNAEMGELQVYLDGHKLTNLPETTAPAYPFEWEINSAGGLSLPVEDITVLKHLRIFDRTATDAEILADYKNVCLSPVGALAVQSSPLKHWGRFNIPAPGSETTVGAGSTVEQARYFIVPDHTLPTNYAYNSLNQVIKQSSPDGGISQFLYDRLGRLTVSQNAEQKQSSTGDQSGHYSYTIFDPLGRIKEVGEKLGAGTIDEAMARNPIQLNTWLASGTNRQVTLTTYDESPVWAPASLIGTQHNLRKRVAATALLSTASASVDGSATDASQNRLAASYYSYDAAGNVGDLYQENTTQTTTEKQYISGTNGLKHLQYEYDLISGKVNKVLYQPGKWDQFYYRYLYDDDNRLTDVYSSRINYVGGAELTNWVREAHYRYYLHGPLARVELGKYNVQGLDYAYTLQGWLKGVNSQALDGTSDLAGDGKIGSAFNNFARDAIGFSLGYYNGDYSPIGGSSASAFSLHYNNTDLLQSGASLYNGNISHATYAIQGIDNGNTAGYSYRYDQLNRLVGMNRHQIGTGSTSWDNTSIIDAYKEKISYDGNGNILTYFRNGANSGSLPLQMDNLSYGYNRDAQGRLVNNRLRHVKDAVTASSYSEDIDGQEDDNYQYDGIGNLIKDNAGNLDQIKWTVYGKIESIQKKDGPRINYGYDASGNRISKSVNTNSGSNTTYYVRDAQGNVLGVYGLNNTSYSWQEQDLYGSSRLGMLKPNLSIASSSPLGNDSFNGSSDPLGNGVEGLRTYELTNHLGNVLSTITDRKIGVDGDGDGSIDYYKADEASAQDYYPFGMQMPGRVFNNGAYRYGYNGQDCSNELNDNLYTAQFWEYDSRIGRRWNMDPINKEYESSYATLSNNPIARMDPNGDSDTASGFRIGIYQSVMKESEARMSKLEQSIKTLQQGIKAMKSLLNQKVGFDLTMSWNVFTWAPEMANDIISGSSVDYMASRIASRMKELQGLVQEYNNAFTDYANAASALKLEVQGARHFDMGGGIILDRLGSAKAVGAMGAVHLNTGAAQSNFALYEIIVDGNTLKFGVADANRIRKGGEWAGYPERLAQQLSRIRKYAPDLEVSAKIHTILQTTKAEMIIAETNKIIIHAKQFGIPLGNITHIKQYAAEFGKGELSAKALEALRKFIKL